MKMSTASSRVMSILSLKEKLDYDGRLTNKVVDAVKTDGIISSKNLQNQ